MTETEIVTEVSNAISTGVVLVAFSFMAMIVGVVLARIAQGLFEDR
jgi:hypothetical protein